ncbi:MAG: signal recognition particle-docking protein FtsY [Cardiobacteriaceae bacterium]|nr:signal recognition particle-docking protein FtsY [Cardiobacteriaceae bacterium]
MVFDWLRRKKQDTPAQELPAAEPAPIAEAIPPAENITEVPVIEEPAPTPEPVAEPEAAPVVQPIAEPEPAKPGYFQRLKQGLAKTRSGFADLFLGKKALDQNLIDDLEMQLLTADVGMEVTDKIIRDVTQKVERNELADVQAVQHAVKTHMQALLEPYARPFDVSTHKPFVLLMTGINGAGKTTTIGKLARHFQQQGLKVMLAAGDTFRAAAVEQLQSWGARHNIPVIAQKTGADAASVAYDALESAKARHIDILIIDTAGRLHTQDHLMEELKKIKRVIQKQDPAAPHETLLVIDAGNGQNALRQAEQFHSAMQLDGIVLTKLDGTAKGGIVFAITERLQLPVRYIGVGEAPEDLRPFNAQDFVHALLYGE